MFRFLLRIAILIRGRHGRNAMTVQVMGKPSITTWESDDRVSRSMQCYDVATQCLLRSKSDCGESHTHPATLVYPG